MIGLVTIGQSPRDDLVPEMRQWLGPAQIEERGAMDGASEGDLRSMRPRDDDYALVTKLRDGRSVTVAKRHLLTSVQACIHSLEDAGAEVIVLLCTGEFPRFECARPLLTAETLLLNGVKAIVGDASVGVLCPLPEQRELTHKKWSGHTGEVRVVCASPYTDDTEEIRAAGESLRAYGPDFVVLDCMGYTQKQRESVHDATGLPVLLARSVVARLVSEVL